MKIILNTPMVQILEMPSSYEMQITAKDGSVIKHEPFPKSLEGLVTAISLSAEILAGKFFLNSVLINSADRPRITAPTKPFARKVT